MDPRLCKLLERYTVAVDLDGTLATKENYSLEFPGEPLPYAKEAMELFRRAGWQILIFTCRPSHIACAWLDKHGIPYDAVNVNPQEIPAFKHVAQKLFANVYIDDSAWPMCGEFVGWPKIIADLEQRQILVTHQCSCPDEFGDKYAIASGRCPICYGNIGSSAAKSAEN